MAAFRAQLGQDTATATTLRTPQAKHLRNLARSDVRLLSQAVWGRVVPGGCLAVDAAAAVSCLGGTMQQMVSMFDTFYQAYTRRRHTLKWLLNAGTAVVAATLPQRGAPHRRVLLHCSTLQAVILGWFQDTREPHITFQVMVDRLVRAARGQSLSARRPWDEVTGRPALVASPSALIKQHVVDALLSLTAAQHPVRFEASVVQLRCPAHVSPPAAWHAHRC